MPIALGSGISSGRQPKPGRSGNGRPSCCGQARRIGSSWSGGENYPGGLTDTEEAFAKAMQEQASRKRRRLRLTVAGAFIVLLAVLLVIGNFWREAVSEANRSEASKLIVLGRVELETDRSAALAYALASLERFDTREARLLALEVLWDGPTAFFFSTHTVALSFSPDGEWLARGGSFDLALYSRATGRPTPLEGHQSIVAFGGFDSDGSRFCSSGFDNTVRLWSVPEGNLEATLPVDGPSSTYFGPCGRRTDDRVVRDCRESRSSSEVAPVGRSVRGDCRVRAPVHVS